MNDGHLPNTLGTPEFWAADVGSGSWLCQNAQTEASTCQDLGRGALRGRFSWTSPLFTEARRVGPVIAL